MCSAAGVLLRQSPKQEFKTEQADRTAPPGTCSALNLHASYAVPGTDRAIGAPRLQKTGRHGTAAPAWTLPRKRRRKTPTKKTLTQTKQTPIPPSLSSRSASEPCARRRSQIRSPKPWSSEQVCFLFRLSLLHFWRDGGPETEAFKLKLVVFILKFAVLGLKRTAFAEH